MLKAEDIEKPRKVCFRQFRVLALSSPLVICNFFPWKEAESYVPSHSRMTVTKVWLDEKKYYEDFYADVFLLIKINKDEEQFTLIW